MYSQQHLLQFASLFVGRRSDYAIQQEDGRYLRTGRTYTYEDLQQHLGGVHTLGSYVMNEDGLCRYAVFDADTDTGLQDLERLSQQLAAELDVCSYLEQSRRGGHLWVFLDDPAPASAVRRWLLPYCPSEMEFYPKQDEHPSIGYGSLIRLPLGVHRRSGRAYPFVQAFGKGFRPVAGSVADTLRWLERVERVTVPDACLQAPQRMTPAPDPHTLITKNRGRSAVSPSRVLTIADWCAAQNPFAVIGRYVQLDRRGMGCCPFGDHHANGTDRHPSLRVYEPEFPGGCCWYCYTWGYGGNVFNFLARYYRLDAKTLWSRILAGAQF